jgi:hypothetical protein
MRRCRIWTRQNCDEEELVQEHKKHKKKKKNIIILEFGSGSVVCFSFTTLSCRQR